MPKTYEIYPIENYAKKISENLDGLLETKPGMYEKTRERYRKLASSLLASVDKITKLIEEDELISASTDEFDELRPDIAESDGISLSSQLKTNTTRYSNARQFSSVNSKPTNFMITETVNQYARVLSSAPKNIQMNCNYFEPYDCAQIINNWFQCRFIDNIDKFVCNFSQIPNWVSSIILYYGKCHEEHSLPYFKCLFEKWETDVRSGVNTKWALPYPIYQISKSDDPRDMTLTAVMLNDILYEYGYCDLTQYSETSVPTIQLESNEVIQIVKTYNPSLENKIRTRFSKTDELLTQCKLTTMEVSEIG